MYVSENAETERSQSIYKCLYTLHLLKSVNNRLYTPINQGITSEDREVYSVYIHTSERKITTSQVYLLVHIYRWMVTN